MFVFTNKIGTFTRYNSKLNSKMSLQIIFCHTSFAKGGEMEKIKYL